MRLHPVRSVLFVCLGNICRSPAAEALMRRLAPDLGIDSAGSGDWHVGAPPHPPMCRAAGRRGLDLTGLRARQVAAADFDRFDLIVAMDRSNLADLAARAPGEGTARLSLLLDHAPETGLREVPDPYYGGDYAQALDLIEAGCHGLRRRLADGG